MEGGAKLLGHSVHPMLIVFPLGLLATAMIFDVLFLTMENARFAEAAYWMLVAGLIGGLAAAVFGWIDWLAIPAETRAKRVGLIHGLTNMTGVALFAISFYLRYDVSSRPPTIAIALTVIASVVALFGGWLGGELVERLGVGVHPGANLNAPNSLSSDSAASAKSASRG